MNDYSTKEPHRCPESSNDRLIKGLTLLIGALTFLASTIALNQAQSSSEATAEMIQLLEEVVDNTASGETLTEPPEASSTVQV